MSTITNSTSVTGLNYNTNAIINNYTNGLTVMSDSGMASTTTTSGTSTTSATSPAYLLDDSLAQMLGTGSSSNSTITAASSLIVPNLLVDSSFSVYNQINSMTPTQLQALGALQNGELPTQTTTNSTAASGSSTLFNASGDPMQWQIGDSQLYAMDPSLAAIVDGATSSAVTTNPSVPTTPADQALQSTQSVGGLVDINA